MLFDCPKFKVVGDTGLLTYIADEINKQASVRVHQLVDALDQNKPDGLLEIVPAYNSILVTYRPDILSTELLIDLIESVYSEPKSFRSLRPRIVEIPVLYGGEFGPDIEFVANCNGLTVEEVVTIHSSTEYFVCLLGFTPGFAYLAGMSEQLHAPRLNTPRDIVTAGSVGIATNQTGIYPIDVAGGWRIIGRTPLKLFDPLNAEPFIYKTGDSLRFRSIDRFEYDYLVNANG
ncbi:MAG: 5-oxoprolinase subunit PxpB [Desulfomonilaceae bacterium]